VQKGYKGIDTDAVFKTLDYAYGGVHKN